MTLPAIQTLYDTIKDRSDIQLITLSADENLTKLSKFMNEKRYTFPVMAGKSYVNRLLPNAVMGQAWIVNKTGSIRLQRTAMNFGGVSQALVDEAIYKLDQVSNQTGR